MGYWDGLSAEERAVMRNAIEEGSLSDVIADFLGHAESGGTVWTFNNDNNAIRPLIAHFASITKDMVLRDLIELIPADRYNDWPHHVPMTTAEIDAALADPNTWVSDYAIGSIMLMTTDHADRLVGRPGHDEQRPLP